MKPEMKYKLMIFLSSIGFLTTMLGILYLIGVPFSEPAIIGVVIGTVFGSFAKTIDYKSRDKYIGLIAVIALITILLLINKNDTEMVWKVLLISPLLFLIILVNDYFNKQLYFRYLKNIENQNNVM
ncbi:hypothetical protein JNUCC31_27920 [Paenibacillus sp. JNUCC31]|uniref:hypothetical protein n=1 Tax=Paenibacillus sp. JNUCC-31 TaxID=2777983 RepID=UPI00177EA53C|nr:hypothetical protein [Paenibacillus sp. JNUCC-31]QOS78493.1 hypothetical protein JNUCC31_27920 [Paenibacillus sp. JNUCC-31]